MLSRFSIQSFFRKGVAECVRHVLTHELRFGTAIGFLTGLMTKLDQLTARLAF